jgi:hypothetical protein
MSQHFFTKLKDFDEEKLKFFDEFNVTKSIDEKYFQKGFGKYKVQTNFFAT